MSAHSTNALADLIRSSAAEQAAALAAGEVSSRELTQAHLDRIAAVDGAVGAFLNVDAECALSQADAADVARKEGQRADRCAGGRQGPHRHPRPGHHRRLADPRGMGAAL